MTILAFGVNHTTAPVDLREQLSIAPDNLPLALADLRQQQPVEEAAILSTCNRTEIYCSQDITTANTALEWFSDYHGLPFNDIKPFLYAHPDAAAVKHLLRVASGLDSMILGEPQVLGQLKTAYQAALDAGHIGKQLNRLFQHSFHVAKMVRSNTEIGSHPVSVAFAAVRMAQQIFGDLSHTKVLLIGAGETIELVARHLLEQQCQKITIANRTLARAKKLSHSLSGTAITFSEIPTHLADADIVIASTASQLPIIGKGTIESAIRKRKHRPIFIVDLAVPRDVEEEVGKLNDVYLYTVDDLQEVIQENLNQRQLAASHAERIIEAQVDEYMDWVQSQDALATVKALRHHADNLQMDVLEKAKKRLREGKDPEAVIEEVARTLSNKLMHSPTTRLNTAKADDNQELITAAIELFGLHNTLNKKN